jgi:hypothetical protein
MTREIAPNHKEGRMYKRFLFALLATVVVVLGLATPASAQVQYANDCDVTTDGNIDELVAHVHVVGDHFGEIHYLILNHQGQDQNNLNVRIYHPDGSLAWSWNSPDNRHSGVWYFRTIDPTVRVYDGTRVVFTAIFDRLLEPDPRCTARVTVAPEV